MSAFLTRYLEQTLPKVLRKRFPELYFDNGLYCPQIGDLELGAQTISIETVSQYGQAAIASGIAQDAPMVEVTVGKDTYKVITIFGGCSYNDMEARAGEFASKNGQTFTALRQERLVAMRRSIDVLSHNLCAFGSSKHGLYGVLNHPEVPLSNTSTTKLYKSDTTSKTIIDFFTTEAHALWTGTNFVEQPTHMFISPKAWKLLSGNFRSDTTDITLLDAIRKVNPSIQVVASLRELDSATLEANGVHAAGTNKDRCMFLNLSQDNFCRHFNPIYMMPPSQNKMNYEVIAYKSVSSVQFDYPYTARYVDYPIATT